MHQEFSPAIGYISRMARYYYRPLQDETLVRALHFLRCRIVREGEAGLEEVDLLIRKFGIEPEDLPTPKKTPKYFRRGEVRRQITKILRVEPLAGACIAKRLNANLNYQEKYRRTYAALNSMKKAGLVECKNGRWRLNF